MMFWILNSFANGILLWKCMYSCGQNPVLCIALCKRWFLGEKSWRTVILISISATCPFWRKAILCRSTHTIFIQMCWMLLQHKTKMWDFCSRKEAESIWAFQLTSNNQCKNKKCMLWDSEKKHITFLHMGEDLHISEKTSSSFLFLIPYNIWEVLVKIFLMFPDVSAAKKLIYSVCLWCSHLNLYGLGGEWAWFHLRTPSFHVAHWNRETFQHFHFRVQGQCAQVTPKSWFTWNLQFC